MKSIDTETYSIHFNEHAYKALNAYIKDHNFSKIFVLVDTHTEEKCLPQFLAKIETEIQIETIEIEPGETHKTIETCAGVWNALSELGADRKSLMINLGGGVVTDLGGFVACTFKRGIKYINVPTTLLAMVDASFGGKNGVDLGSIKNQIGVIQSGDLVLIDVNFLDTLPQNQLKSGLAEMLKHGLIKDREYWEQLTDLKKLTTDDLSQLIYDSVLIKNDIVTKDPFEQNERKHLNFGHTLGHAIESYFMSTESKKELLHGEAIGIGMVLECYLSMKLLNFPNDDCKEVKRIIHQLFGKVAIEASDYNLIIDLMKYDKKNEHGNVNFVLLKNIGQPKANCIVENHLIEKAFDYYASS